MTSVVTLVICMLIIDTPQNCTSKVSCLKQAGVSVVLRYYARASQPELPEKRLTRPEAVALSQAAISVGVVYQYKANNPTTFSKTKGLSDGRYARQYAANQIKQPGESAIYFGVDFDVSDNQMDSHIVPHFEAIGSVFNENNGLPAYDIGVYGSWIACSRLVSLGLAKLAWLAQSTGWGGKEGYKAYLSSRDWTLSQGFPQTDICSLDYDPNEAKDQHSFGQFLVSLT
jgi:uncharacterized protein RhaS with RHS repeats